LPACRYVLIVEDHDEVRASIQLLLAPFGYDVRCATTIDDAIATLRETPPPCLVLWDPTTLPMNGRLIASAREGSVHIATIPVGIVATGQDAHGSPIITKRLTSREAVLSVVRQHCSGPQEPPLE
jgi:CheY-like chemotaxis protein